jgi:hypothetical protein
MTKNLVGVIGLAAVALVGLAGCGEVPEETGEAVSADTAPDFALLIGTGEVNPQIRKRGTGGAFDIVLEPLNGFDGVVTFTVTGLPPVTTSNFDPPTLTGSGDTFLLYQTTKNGDAPGGIGTPIGTFPLTITGTSGALSHTTIATLITR